MPPYFVRITYEHLIRANVGLERLRFEQGKNWIYVDESTGTAAIKRSI